jgi:Leucine-rich repeat (LRR) protein
MKKQLLLLSMLFLSYVSIAQIPDSEKQAMLSLYNSLSKNGTEWSNIFEGYKWKDQNPISDWHGVTIENGHVIGIDIIANSPGTISSSIGDLTELKTLNFHGIGLTGSIPPEIGSLTKLNDIRLSRNQLTGSLPIEIGNLKNLENLLLYQNQISGDIPSELANCTKLTSLYLDENKLTGNIPNSLASLPLVQLFLNDNLLSGNVTNIFSSWPDLVFLGVTGLTGDLNLSNNPKISIFYAPNNQFTSINVKSGNNTILTNFTTTNSANLTCIQVDNQTDAINKTSSYQHWNVDNSVTLSENCNSLSILDYTKQNSVLIYPKPTKDLISIKSELNNIVEIKIYNYSGQLLYFEESENAISTINVSKLNSGVYLIQFKDDLNNFSRTKLIKR